MLLTVAKASSAGGHTPIGDNTTVAKYSRFNRFGEREVIATKAGTWPVDTEHAYGQVTGLPF